jgi:type VI secretion system protein ImpI
MSQQMNIQITNTKVLERRTKPYIYFNEDGGSIGADDSDFWQLYDRHGEITGNHAMILMEDEKFCIQQGAADVFVNQSTYPLGTGNKAVLHDADVLQLGRFNMRVGITSDNQFNVAPNASLEDLLGDDQQSALLLDPQWQDRKKQRVLDNVDPELALSQTMVICDSEDPESYLVAQARLDSEKNELFDLIDSDNYDDTAYVQRALSHTFSKMVEKSESNGVVGNNGKGVQKMSNDFSSKLEDLEDLVMGKSHPPSNSQSTGQISVENFVDESGHLAASPLQRGLGVSLKQSDSMQTHDVLEEIGETLKEAVQGLLKIHASVKGQAGLSSKVLQPIEDNPLRLDLNYQDTMAAMFDHNRSMVHLAAPMAVKESLNYIHLHQQATQYATQKALDAILQALNPNTLSQRFERYRGKGQREAGQEGWAWEMYKHYYSELISSRQQGFEKLYSEVFEQAYDQRLRELQHESNDHV